MTAEKLIFLHLLAVLLGGTIGWISGTLLAIVHNWYERRKWDKCGKF